MSKPAKPSIHRLIELHKLLLDFRAVQRVTRIPGTQERENDVDHSYTLAMTAWFLAPYFPELDRDTVIRMALVHDLTEIHAGDTFVFGEAHHRASKQQREATALARLAADWPDFPEMSSLAHQYEARSSNEAKFVYALDKVMPILISVLGGGRDFKDYDVTIAVMHAEKRDKVALSAPVNDYYNELLEVLRTMPHLFPTGSATSQQR